MSQSPDELNFSIDSRLLEELGENLVTRNHVAVAELIKNAYDADATEVELKFINARQDKDTHTSEIRITDDGVGMTYEEIDENWMRIGTTDKIRNPETQDYGREKTGNKGIGRFSCRRLADRLELTSIAEDPNSEGYVKTHVKFPWKEFARNTDVDSIPVPSEVEYLDEADTTGVSLRLLNLRDKWSQRDFNTLRRNVLTLSVVQQQRREGYEEDPGFEIEFDAPEFEKGQGSLLDQVYEAGWGVLEGKFKDGNVNLTLEGKKIGERKHTLRKEYSGVEETTFKIAFIPLNKEHFRDQKTLSLERAREITSDYGGIRVYQDGFRVYPYGGPDDDWLGMDRYYSRRIGRPDEEFDDLSGDLEFHTQYDRTMLLHPRNQNLIGRISLASGADLEMKADREGFIQNQTLEYLKEGVQLSLQWLTLQYSNYQALNRKEDLEEKTKKLNEQLEKEKSSKSVSGNFGSSTSSDSSESTLTKWNKSKKSSSGGGSNESSSSSSYSSRSSSSGSSASGTDTLDQAVSVIQSASDSIDKIDNTEDDSISEAVEAATEVVKTSVEQKQKEVDFYRSAFSVNQFVFSFMHELRDVILELETAKGDIKQAAGDLPHEKQNELHTIATDIDNLKSRFEQQMNLFGILTDSGNELSRDVQRIEGEVEELVDAIRYISREYNIDVETEVPVNLYTPSMYQTELYSILINLLTNSIKAVIAGGDSERRILIEGKKVDNDVILGVYDTGIGIPKEYREEVFEPLVTDPTEELYNQLNDEMPDKLSSQLGSGSGLGLSIVNDIAQNYGGHVRIADKSDWNTSVEVLLNDE